VWEQSRTARAIRAVTTAAAQASEGSVLLRAAESLAARTQAVVRHSYCYRWLTAEPDPDVIVIDLRETRTVGPFVRLLEGVIDPIERAWTDSRLASAVAAVSAALAGSRTGQPLAAVLEPPEPPATDDEENE